MMGMVRAMFLVALVVLAACGVGGGSRCETYVWSGEIYQRCYTPGGVTCYKPGDEQVYYDRCPDEGPYEEPEGDATTTSYVGSAP